MPSQSDPVDASPSAALARLRGAASQLLDTQVVVCTAKAPVRQVVVEGPGVISAFQWRGAYGTRLLWRRAVPPSAKVGDTLQVKQLLRVNVPGPRLASPKLMVELPPTEIKLDADTPVSYCSADTMPPDGSHLLAVAVVLSVAPAMLPRVGKQLAESIYTEWCARVETNLLHNVFKSLSLDDLRVFVDRLDIGMQTSRERRGRLETEAASAYVSRLWERARRAHSDAVYDRALWANWGLELWCTAHRALRGTDPSIPDLSAAATLLERGVEIQAGMTSGGQLPPCLNYGLTITEPANDNERKAAWMLESAMVASGLQDTTDMPAWKRNAMRNTGVPTCKSICYRGLCPYGGDTQTCLRAEVPDIEDTVRVSPTPIGVAAHTLAFTLAQMEALGCFDEDDEVEMSS